MKTIEMIETFDGERHDTEREARQHIDRLIGDLVCPLAARLVRAKYAEAVTLLAETEIETMRKIVAAHDDLALKGANEC